MISVLQAILERWAALAANVQPTILYLSAASIPIFARASPVPSTPMVKGTVKGAWPLPSQFMEAGRSPDRIRGGDGGLGRPASGFPFVMGKRSWAIS